LTGYTVQARTSRHAGQIAIGVIAVVGVGQPSTVPLMAETARGGSGAKPAANGEPGWD